MAGFFKSTWRMIYFWKFLLAGVALMFTIIVIRVESEDFGLVFDDAIKAPLFALISAGTLFIGMIPKNPGPNDVLSDLVVRSVGAATACLAGWYWLSGETGGDPSRYLLVLFPVILLIVVILVIIPFLSYVSAFFLDGRSPGASKENC